MASLNAWALTTLADVKETMGIASSDQSWDNIIIRKINQGTDMIERYCGLNNSQHFTSTSYTEEYDGTGSNQLILKMRPVITFTSLEVRNGIDNQNSWDTIASTDYFVDSTAGVIDGLVNFQTYWNRYRATYTAGFATIPSDLAEACATLAAFLAENSTTGQAVKSKQQGPKRIEYHDVSAGADNIFDQLGIDDILAPYMQIAILADM